MEISQLDREKMIDDCNREIAEIKNEFEMLNRASFAVGEKVTTMVKNVPVSTSEGNAVAAVKAASVAVSAAPVVPTRNSNTTTLFT